MRSNSTLIKQALHITQKKLNLPPSSKTSSSISITIRLKIDNTESTNRPPMRSNSTLIDRALDVAQNIQPLLYHSTFQTAHYQEWINQQLTDEKKKQLAKLAEDITGSIFKLKCLPDEHDIDNQYRLFSKLKKEIQQQCEKTREALETQKFNTKTDPITTLTAANRLIQKSTVTEDNTSVELIDHHLVELYSLQVYEKLRINSSALSNEIDLFLEKAAEVLNLRDKLSSLQIDIKTLHSFKAAIAQLDNVSESRLRDFLLIHLNLAATFMLHADTLIDLSNHLLSFIEEQNLRHATHLNQHQPAFFNIKSRVQAKFEKACMLYQNNEFEKALAVFEKILSEHKHSPSFLKYGSMIIEGQGCAPDPLLGCWYLQLACAYSHNRQLRHYALMLLEDAYLKKVTGQMMTENANSDNSASMRFTNELNALKNETDFISRAFHFAESYLILHNAELKRDKPDEVLACTYFFHATTCHEEAKQYLHHHPDESDTNKKIMSEFDVMLRTFEHHVIKENLPTISQSAAPALS